MANIDRLPIEEQNEVLRNQNADLTKRIKQVDDENIRLKRQVVEARTQTDAVIKQRDEILNRIQSEILEKVVNEIKAGTENGTN